MSDEQSVGIPIRNPILWQNKGFYKKEFALTEAARVFDICHGCRRCFNLCSAFPSIFDAVDASDSGEVEGLKENDYWKVVNHCYLCDMCFRAKCPYVPPHPFNIDFPSLMLQLKAIQYKKQKVSLRDNFMSRPQLLGTLMSVPFVAGLSRVFNKLSIVRLALEKFVGIAKEAVLPQFYYKTLVRRIRDKQVRKSADKQNELRKVALFSTCYGNYNVPDICEDLIAIYNYNNISVELIQKQQCCGMPRWELGDIESVVESLKSNLPVLSEYINKGYDIVVFMPSCTFMMKEIWPLINQGEETLNLKAHIFDPFEYLMHLHKLSLLKTDFKHSLGNITLHAPCHTRAQNIGNKTRDVLSLVSGTKVHVIENCSGHNGTYAMKKEYHKSAAMICKSVVKKMKNQPSDNCCSDCPMAANHIESQSQEPITHPLKLLRQAYGINYNSAKVSKV